jgi:hypothetical protein
VQRKHGHGEHQSYETHVIIIAGPRRSAAVFEIVLAVGTPQQAKYILDPDPVHRESLGTISKWLMNEAVEADPRVFARMQLARLT